MNLQDYLRWVRDGSVELRPSEVDNAFSNISGPIPAPVRKSSPLPVLGPLAYESIHGKGTNDEELYTPTEYRGVHRYEPTQEWVARIVIDGRMKHIGCFSTALEAAKAYDRTALEFDEQPILNFIDGFLNPNRFRSLYWQRQGTAAKPAAPPKGPEEEGGEEVCRYRGVQYKPSTKQWKVTIKLGGKWKHRVGVFDNPVDAAKAYDEAALKHHKHPILNFPKDRPPPQEPPMFGSNEVGFPPPHQVAAPAAEVPVGKKKSQFRGVSYNAVVKKWVVVRKTDDGRTKYLGCFSDEFEAALAYDRAALLHDPIPILNFVDGRLNPYRRMRMDTYIKQLNEGKLGAVADEFPEQFERSNYLGVSYRPALQKWVSEITLPDGTTKYLGTYTTEVQAAAAYDRAAVVCLPPDPLLNFPSSDDGGGADHHNPRQPAPPKTNPSRKRTAKSKGKGAGLSGSEEDDDDDDDEEEGGADVLPSDEEEGVGGEGMAANIRASSPSQPQQPPPPSPPSSSYTRPALTTTTNHHHQQAPPPPPSQHSLVSFLMEQRQREEDAKALFNQYRRQQMERYGLQVHAPRPPPSKTTTTTLLSALPPPAPAPAAGASMVAAMATTSPRVTPMPTASASASSAAAVLSEPPPIMLGGGGATIAAAGGSTTLPPPPPRPASAARQGPSPRSLPAPAPAPLRKPIATYPEALNGVDRSLPQQPPPPSSSSSAGAAKNPRARKRSVSRPAGSLQKEEDGPSPPLLPLVRPSPPPATAAGGWMGGQGGDWAAEEKMQEEWLGGGGGGGGGRHDYHHNGSYLDEAAGKKRKLPSPPPSQQQGAAQKSKEKKTTGRGGEEEDLEMETIAVLCNFKHNSWTNGTTTTTITANGDANGGGSANGVEHGQPWPQLPQRETLTWV